MKAVRVHQLGGPEILRYEEIPDPSPKSGEVLVKIEAAGLNFLDIYYRSGFHWGGHHRRALPYIPGAEAAGTVVEVGPDVKDIKIGDRVAYGISNGYGSYAELYAVPSWHLFKLPSSVDFQTAAAAMLQGMTAHYLTHTTYSLKPNDTALIRWRNRVIVGSNKQAARRSSDWHRIDGGKGSTRARGRRGHDDQLRERGFCRRCKNIN
jgi:NADPH2:quinone reductase